MTPGSETRLEILEHKIHQLATRFGEANDLDIGIEREIEGSDIFREGALEINWRLLNYEDVDPPYVKLPPPDDGRPNELRVKYRGETVFLRLLDTNALVSYTPGIWEEEVERLHKEHTNSEPVNENVPF